MCRCTVADYYDTTPIDAESSDLEDSDSAERDKRRRPDLLPLLAGIASLLVSAYVLTDGAIWLPILNPRWLLAGGAMLVGLLLLGGSMRGKRRKQPQ